MAFAAARRVRAFVSPSGRMSRRGFLVAYTMQSLALAAIIAIFVLADDPEGGLQLSTPDWIALAGAYALLTYAGYVIGARRMRDRGLSGWWTLLAALPVAGPIVWFALNATVGRRPAHAADPDGER